MSTETCPKCGAAITLVKSWSWTGKAMGKPPNQFSVRNLTAQFTCRNGHSFKRTLRTEHVPMKEGQKA